LSRLFVFNTIGTYVNITVGSRAAKENSYDRKICQHWVNTVNILINSHSYTDVENEPGVEREQRKPKLLKARKISV